MKNLIGLFLVLITNIAFSYTDLNTSELDLQYFPNTKRTVVNYVENGATIQVDYIKNSFIPYDFKYYELTMAAGFRLTITHPEFTGREMLAVTLYNKASNDTGLARMGSRMNTKFLQWDEVKKHYIYEYPIKMSYTSSDALWIAVQAVVSFGLRLDVQVNGQTLSIKDLSL